MKNLIITVFLIASSTPALAEVPLFGEVALGYDSSKIAATNLVGPHENGSTTGFAVMARGGYLYKIFMLGVQIDGTAGYLKYDLPQIKNGYWNKTSTSVFAGFDFGVVRLWGNYGVYNQSRLALDYGTYVTDKIYSDGTLYKAGVGVALNKRIRLNAEYYINTPNRMQNNTGVVNFGTTYSKWQETGYTFSVSYSFFGAEIKQQ